MALKIYVTDDEQNIRDMIATFLIHEGFEAITFENGDQLIACCDTSLPDLVILDIIMPGTNGLDICARLRKIAPSLPIIIVSAKDSPYDRVQGFTCGSDDYLIKPFLPEELIARVKALLRRSRIEIAANQSKELLSFGGLALNSKMRSATLNGSPLTLTPTEFDFLSYMIQNSGRAVSRDELLRELWQIHTDIDTRVADDLVKRLRKKLRKFNSSLFIETVWGYGFRLVEGDIEH